MLASVRSHGSQIQRAGATSTSAPGGGTGQSPCATPRGGASGVRTTRAAGRAGAFVAGFPAAGLRCRRLLRRRLPARPGGLAPRRAGQRERGGDRRAEASEEGAPAAAHAPPTARRGPCARARPRAGTSAAPAAPRRRSVRRRARGRRARPPWPAVVGVVTVAASSPARTRRCPPSGRPSQPVTGTSDHSRRQRPDRAPRAHRHRVVLRDDHARPEALARLEAQPRPDRLVAALLRPVAVEDLHLVGAAEDFLEPREPLARGRGVGGPLDAQHGAPAGRERAHLPALDAADLGVVERHVADRQVRVAPGAGRRCSRT